MSFFRRLKGMLLILVPACVIVLIWQIGANANRQIAFLTGRPSEVALIFFQRILDGSLLTDTIATLIPVIVGFAGGSFFGTILGLFLWRFKTFDQISRPYLIALGAVPAFIFAPLLVVWFGTGLVMKIVLVFLSTVLVASSQAASGASEVDPDFFRLFQTFRAPNATVFRHLVLPSAAAWFFAGLRLNIGFALLGEFVGEFISSDRGLAHRALFDAGLYDLSAVWVSAFVIAIVAIILYGILAGLESKLFPWKTDSPAEQRRAG